MTEIKSMTTQELRSYVSQRQLTGIEFIEAGQRLLVLSKDLSNKVTGELMEPISVWIDDEDFLKRWNDIDRADAIRDKHREDKQKQRSHNDYYERVARLEEARRQNQHKKSHIEQHKLIPKLRETVTFQMETTTLDTFKDQYMTECTTIVLEGLSPKVQAMDRIKQQFEEARALPAFRLMPWPMIIKIDLGKGTTFNSLPAPSDPELAKKARVAELQHMLYMMQTGAIEASQMEPFGEIEITPLGDTSIPKGSLKIITKDGGSLDRDWTELSDAQRNEIIADSLNGKILCQGA